MNSSVSISEVDDGNNDVAGYQITVKREKFNDFFQKLLTQPRISSWSRRGVFTIDFVKIINLVDIVDQRVRGQNKSILVDFSATFHFSDDRIKRVTSYESFSTFNDNLGGRTTGVYLNLTYLVDFPNRGAPEKQEINIRFLSSRDSSSSIGGRGGEGHVSIEVAHTEVSWGDDIINIVSQFTNKIFEKRPFYRLKDEERTMVLAFLLGAIASIFVFFHTRAAILENKFIHITEIFRYSGKNATTEEEILRLLQIIDVRLNKISVIYIEYVYIFLVSILPGITALCIGYLLVWDTKSYIVLTDADRALVHEDKIKIRKTISACFLAIFLGAVGSTLSTWIWERLIKYYVM